MILFREITDLLDRKFDSLMKSARQDFMLDLSRFMDFLTEDERIKDVTMKIYLSYAEQGKKYQETLEKEKQAIVALGEKIKTTYPELDDSSKEMPAPGFSAREYEDSFAGFNDMAKGVKRNRGFCLEPDMMSDDSDPHKMLNIIITKFQEFEVKDEHGKKTKKIDEKIQLEYNQLRERREYEFRKWLNSCRVSAGHGITELFNIVRKINPEPKQYKSFDEIYNPDNLTKLMKDAFFNNWVEDATYGVVSKYSNYKPARLDDKKLDEIFEKLRYRARRVYEAVREEIGTQLLYRQILNKYMRRSMWYDAQSIWDIVQPDGKTFSNKREHLLTLHLARYLFDQGISVLYRMKAGQHEMDMVDPEAHHPLVLEVKVYTDDGSKQDVIQGVAQLHTYLNNISATKDVTDGFYVVYRFGGPLYELPEKISTNRFTLHTILVDMGKSQDSGRKQSKPVVISMDEVMKQVEQVSNQKELVPQDAEAVSGS